MNFDRLLQDLRDFDAYARDPKAPPAFRAWAREWALAIRCACWRVAGAPDQ